MRKYKGLDLLIQALGRAELRDLTDVKLLIAGEFYDEKQPYLDSIRDLGLEDRVIVRDEYIAESEVKHYFAAASIVAQTYRTATQSGVTQIAYHFARPMLVTDVGGLSEIVAHERVGYVSPPRSSAIAADLRRFFVENREEAFSAAAAAERPRFGWDNFAKDFTSFVEGLRNSEIP